jgi:EpsI family protein
MTRRSALLVVVLLSASLARQQLQAVELGPSRDLRQLPLTLETWVGSEGPPFDPSVIDVLRPDSYVNRIYQSGPAAAGLYVGYHRSQRRGSAIHSPLNCLPGSGWQPVSSERVPLAAAGTANRVVVQKGEDRQLVLYWYQSARRVEGDEYRSKIYLVLDALRSRRNDAALVRIMVPIPRGKVDGEGEAEQVARGLAVAIEPRIRRLLFASS